MLRATASLVHQLVDEEIRRMVADAIQSGESVSVSRQAAILDRSYPNSGLSAEEIKNRVLKAANSAKVPVEI
jgi:hypothetical protein